MNNYYIRRLVVVVVVVAVLQSAPQSAIATSGYTLPTVATTADIYVGA